MTSGWLPPVDRIAAAFAGMPEAVAPVFLADAARGSNRGLPTLLSWWQLQGHTLPDSLAAELACHRHRQSVYGDVLNRVRHHEPGMVPAKGPTVWALYPPGLLRLTADLDLLFPSAASMWSVAQLLVADGWAPSMMWAWRLAAGTHFHIVVARPSRQPMVLADERIELATIAYEGDHVWREPRLRSWAAGEQPGTADCFAWFLDELGERPLHMRDLFDLAVLAHAAEDADLESVAADVARLVDAYRLRPQLRRLRRDARRWCPAAVSILEAIGRRLARTPASQWSGPWPFHRHPLAGGLSLAQAASRKNRPAAARDGADSVLVAAQRHWSPLWLLQRGVPLYGLAIPNGRPVAGQGVALCSDDDAFWFETPAGRFVGSLGPAVLQQWVDRASSDVPAPQQVALL